MFTCLHTFKLPQVAEHGWRLLPFYTQDILNGQWELRPDAASFLSRRLASVKDSLLNRPEPASIPWGQVDSSTMVHVSVRLASGDSRRFEAQQQRQQPGCFSSLFSKRTKKPAGPIVMSKEKLRTSSLQEQKAQKPISCSSLQYSAHLVTKVPASLSDLCVSEGKSASAAVVQASGGLGVYSSSAAVDTATGALAHLPALIPMLKAAPDAASSTRQPSKAELAVYLAEVRWPQSHFNHA